MQTWIVHMRHPFRLWRELGTRGFLSLQLLIGGSILSALIHPFFMALVIHHAFTGELFELGDNSEHSVRKLLALIVLGVGYFGTIALGMAGLRRRNVLGLSWVLATVPIYWLLLSAAAWRAMWQLVFARYRWEKTQHGLARSSLRSQRSDPPTRSNVRPIRDFVGSRWRTQRL